MKRGISAAADVRKKVVVVQVMRAGIDISKRKSVCVRANHQACSKEAATRIVWKKAARARNRRDVAIEIEIEMLILLCGRSALRRTLADELCRHAHSTKETQLRKAWWPYRAESLQGNS